MLTKTQEQILAFLMGNPEDLFTIRGIAKKLNKSYTLVYNNLSRLHKEDIITKKNVPPATIVRLNEFAPAEVLIDIELKRKNEFIKKYPWAEVMLKDILSNAKNPFFILLVFGSYAKETQTKKSDIDLLFVVKDKKDIKEIEDAAQKAYTKAKKGLNFVDINDFIEMLKNTNKFNIGNEAKKHHIALYGVEAYFQLLGRVY